MKRPLFFIMFLLSSHALAAMPFTISGDKIQTIFNTPVIWKNIGGNVESIRFIQHKNKTSRYEFSTTEFSGNRPVNCIFTADVTATGDELSPTWIVTGTDFSRCQK